VRMWSGHFDALMSKIEPDGGRWTGLALPYHLQEGWYVESPWKVPDLQVVTQQWEQLAVAGVRADCQALYSAVLELMREAGEPGATLWIAEE
jgi:hypothetical protein